MQDLLIEAQRLFNESYPRLGLTEDMPDEVREREIIGLQLSCVMMVYGARIFGAAPGKHSRSVAPHFGDVVSGGVAAMIFNFGTSWQLSSDGKPRTATDACASWFARIERALVSRIASLDQTDRCITLGKGEGGEITPKDFDFREHVKGAR